MAKKLSMYKSLCLKEGGVRLRHVGEILGCEGEEALVQGAQSSCGCPWIPGSVQGQAGHGAWSTLGQWKVSLP
uniref:Uncharacterized protein n=1 Tax=Malurus cyaneus samueli TaxID=2593467 RepID=A0A8C5U9L8_9PASS